MIDLPFVSAMGGGGLELIGRPFTSAICAIPAALGTAKALEFFGRSVTVWGTAKVATIAAVVDGALEATTPSYASNYEALVILKQCCISLPLSVALSVATASTMGNAVVNGVATYVAQRAFNEIVIQIVIRYL
ncbi:MAG: hypothetical protein JWO53_810 [Chlamydiia bacterium]|nr:hypothetical protein [Chlamydiia bacterium]